MLKIKALAPYALLIVLSCLLVELFLWRQYAFVMIRLDLKALLGVERTADLYERGAICNALARPNCSRRAFTLLLELNPRDKKAIANLAITEARERQWKTAKVLFENYLSMDGSAYDVMYWYARTLEALNFREEAAQWYYQSLFRRPSFYEALVAQTELLAQLGRGIEALSLLRDIQNLTAQRQLIQQQAENLGEIMLKQNPAVASDQTVYLPSLSGKEDYYLPVWLKDGGRITFIKLNLAGRGIITNSDQLEEAGLSHLESGAVEEISHLGERVKATKTRLPYVRLGHRVLRNVAALICDQCEPEVGSELIPAATVSKIERQGIKFTKLAAEVRDVASGPKPE